MVTPRRLTGLAILVACSVTFGLASSPAGATHTWGGYHWARTSNPFSLKLGNNVSRVWSPYLNTSSSDWSKSTVLDTTVVAGKGGKRCTPALGRIEVCNGAYGQNGWLGIATIYGSDQHITQATVQLNDTYFTTAAYNTPAWRNFVMCQEVGHTFGLAHQDEDFTNSNLGSCMDYTNDPSTNQRPNAHDYEQLISLYSHSDSSTTIAAGTGSSLPSAASENSAGWGKPVAAPDGGKPTAYLRSTAEGDDIFTFVVWAGEHEHDHS